MPIPSFLQLSSVAARTLKQLSALRLGPMCLKTALIGSSVLLASTYTQKGLAQDTSRIAQLAACPAALSQMREHTVSSGDTVASLATAYRLEPNTILRFNPSIGNTLVPGSTLTLPPFNGAVVDVAASDTWQTLAERYNRRADLLFEVNGCVSAVPSRVFVPGSLSTGPVAAGSTSAVGAASTVRLPRELNYPLDSEASIVVSYGWQPHSTRDELVFNSGIAFAIAAPVNVVSADSGTVAFVGEQSGYGNLVVINHADGLQTRYANLSDISVSVGQSVGAEQGIGRVGSAQAATYLYFEVRKNSAEGWVAQDPGKYVPSLDLQ